MSIKMKFVRVIVKKMSKGMFDTDQIDIERIRGVLQKAYAGHKPEKGVKIDFVNYDGVEVAICKPNNQTSENIVYYVHGGGLVTGDRHTALPYTSQLALATGCRVVSCSYRLAPEDPFPAGFNDSYSVYKHKEVY